LRSILRHPTRSLHSHGDETEFEALLARRSKLAGFGVVTRHTMRTRAHGRKAELGASPRPRPATQHVARQKFVEETRKRKLRYSGGRIPGAFDAMSMTTRHAHGIFAPGHRGVGPTKRARGLCSDGAPMSSSMPIQLVDFAVMGESLRARHFSVWTSECRHPQCRARKT